MSPFTYVLLSDICIIVLDVILVVIQSQFTQYILFMYSTKNTLDVKKYDALVKMIIKMYAFV